MRNEIADFKKGFKGTSKKHQIVSLELLRNHIVYQKLYHTDVRNADLVTDYVDALVKQERGESTCGLCVRAYVRACVR